MCIWYSGWCIWSSEFWIWFFWWCIWYLGRCIWYYLAMGKLWSSNREAVAGEIIARLGSRKCEHRTQFKTKCYPFLNLIYTITTTWFKQILFTISIHSYICLNTCSDILLSSLQKNTSSLTKLNIWSICNWEGSTGFTFMALIFFLY